MDFHVPSDPRLQFGLNGSQESSKRNSQHRKPFEDEALQFLSQEEKECILFFEETIDSLDDDSEDPGLGLSSGSSTSVDGRSATPSPVTVTGPETSPSPKEHDIIDLVQNQPAQTEPRDVPFNPPVPDFRTVAASPESHFEFKAKRELRENFPSELPLPPASAAPAPHEDGFGHGLYQPAGSIPTPVLIAQHIAGRGGSTPLSAAYILSGRSRSRSTESQSPPPESPVRQGPPTLAKPSRYPDNISFVLGNREYNKTIVKAAVNVNERRAQVLANLTVGPLAPDPEDQPARNIPNRSMSFQDPSPDKSRMEALSKLGLAHKRSLPSSHPRGLTPTPQSTAKPETSSSNVRDYNSKPKAATPSPVPSLSATSPAGDFNSYGGKSIVVNPSSMLQNKMEANSHSVVANETKPTLVPQLSPDNGSPVDYNSYGGKSIVMNPSVGSMPKRDSPSQHQNESGPGAVRPPQTSTAAWSEASLCNFNNCGGKTRVMTFAPASTVKAEPPSESSVPLNSKARPKAASLPPSYKPETGPSSLSSYGVRSRTVTPSHTSDPKPEVTASDPRPAPAQPSVAPRPHSYRVEPRPTEAPRAPRQEPAHSSGSRGGGPLPETRRRVVSKPSLFPQGITVQFSGRGATDESRREALRKLGLLKNAP